MKIRIVVLLSMIIYACSPVEQQGTQASFSGEKDNPEIYRKATELLNKMTLQEKIGQLNLFTSDWDVTGPTMRKGYKEDIKAGKVGAIFNAYTANYTRELQRLAVEETRLGIPLLFGYDVIHGHRTIFPISLGEAASWDLAAMESSAKVAATEAAAEGIHWTFAPMVDIARDPRWGRVSEGAGEDTYLGVQIAKARVKGFQGDDLSAENTVLACAKHFAAYGMAQAGRDYHTVDMSERVLREVYLPPFKACVDAGVATFMSSFNELDGMPASGNAYLFKEILRDEWGFNGFVVTDYTSINEMIPHGVATNEYEAGALAMNAGIDMDMQGAVYANHLEQLVKDEKVTLQQIDNAVMNILLMKYRLGLFDDPYKYCNEEREKAVIMSDEHLAIARDVARKSIVLLKNEGQTLPLKTENIKIGLIGPLADARRDLIGSWSAAGDWKKSVTLKEGLEKQLGQNGQLLYAKGCEINDQEQKGFTEALAVAQKSDVVVLVLGEAWDMSGEAASRSDITLPGVQTDLLQALQQTGKPLIVVLMNGRPLALEKEVSLANAMLETWFLGTTAGDAIADVIFGKYNPSGKLPITFPRSVGQVPTFYNMKNTGRPMDPNNKYTSKYLDIPNTPLFPFGFGLSYSSFEYTGLEVSTSQLPFNGKLEVSVSVKNTGTVSGEEVVQLYIRDLVASVTRPVKELKGFQKILLTPGESRTVSFELTSDDLAFYTKDMTFTAEPGKFKVMVGTNSEELQETEFELTGKSVH
ncbi:glycoside hydrolase family 3 N-terminal domain-containing protein [Rapidithrix thailandica]|uniref:Periplasmic beta-glucosidase n=1 Tax=Rapidithrix thailandica TaxID=413964 RepID=A0AAW9S492_9BACT